MFQGLYIIVVLTVNDIYNDEKNRRVEGVTPSYVAKVIISDGSERRFLLPNNIESPYDTTTIVALQRLNIYVYSLSRSTASIGTGSRCLVKPLCAVIILGEIQVITFENRCALFECTTCTVVRSARPS